MRKTLLVLSLAGLSVLAIAGDANAQRRGYGGGWGNSSVGWGSGYYPQSAYYGSYYGGGGYSPYYQGYGYGYSPNYYYTTPNYAVNSTPYSPNYYYTTPNYAVNSTSYYSGPAAMNGAPADERTALISARVPADAEIWIEEQRMTQTGPDRLYITPRLPNKDTSYYYDVRARWTENGSQVERTQRIRFRAGERVALDFKSSANEATREKDRQATMPVLPVTAPGQVQVLTPGTPFGTVRQERSVETQPAQPGTQPGTTTIVVPTGVIGVGGVPIGSNPLSPNPQLKPIPSSTPVILSSNPAIPGAPTPAATPTPGTTPQQPSPTTVPAPAK
jgi:uncharacterized protein (TIGR03000 family)